MAERVGLARSLRELPANLQLRCCVGRTGFSSSTTLGEKNKRPLKGAFCFSGGGASPLRRMLSVTSGQFSFIPGQ